MAAGIGDYQGKCRDGALHAFGTARIFEQRANRLKRKTDALTWVGLVVPLLIGALVGTFGRNKLWGLVITIAAVIAAVQLAMSLWSLIKRWPEELAYSSGSVAANDSLATRYTALADDPPVLATLRVQFEKLEVEDTSRRDRDSEKGVTEKERRMGMRAALRKYQRACAACLVVPTTMEPSTCGVCGQF
ncbi:mobilome CxxCx(11)CxxC protein [Streptomyces stelliscabiei]|uniref:mobilome CxxCx(11)CxxC protein n=1 Tax=Streptomyces stelliscabiei TaxID=146820 RepID=UPI002FF432E5